MAAPCLAYSIYQYQQLKQLYPAMTYKDYLATQSKVTLVWLLLLQILYWIPFFFISIKAALVGSLKIAAKTFARLVVRFIKKYIIPAISSFIMSLIATLVAKVKERSKQEARQVLKEKFGIETEETKSAKTSPQPSPHVSVSPGQTRARHPATPPKRSARTYKIVISSLEEKTDNTDDPQNLILHLPSEFCAPDDDSDASDNEEKQTETMDESTGEQSKEALQRQILFHYDEMAFYLFKCFKRTRLSSTNVHLQPPRQTIKERRSRRDESRGHSQEFHGYKEIKVEQYRRQRKASLTQIKNTFVKTYQQHEPIMKRFYVQLVLLLIEFDQSPEAQLPPSPEKPTLKDTKKSVLRHSNLASDYQFEDIASIFQEASIDTWEEQSVEALADKYKRIKCLRDAYYNMAAIPKYFDSKERVCIEKNIRHYATCVGRHHLNYCAR